MNHQISFFLSSNRLCISLEETFSEFKGTSFYTTVTFDNTENTKFILDWLNGPMIRACCSNISHSICGAAFSTITNVHSTSDILFIHQTPPYQLLKGKNISSTFANLKISRSDSLKRCGLSSYVEAKLRWEKVFCLAKTQIWPSAPAGT